jgi:hypothetical protein
MKKKIIAGLLMIVALALVVFFWPAAPMEPLDRFRAGDILAKQGDIKISKSTPLYVMYKYHPRVATAERRAYGFKKNIAYKYRAETIC